MTFVYFFFMEQEFRPNHLINDKSSLSYTISANQMKLLDNKFVSMAFNSQKVDCLFCDHKFDLSFKLNQNKYKIDRLREHLILNHQFIISDINEIDDLNGYLHYWRNRIIKITDLKSICALIKTNSKPEDKGESLDYYMLCPDVLSEDRELREELKLAKLNYLINIQEIERKDNKFDRVCFFCRKTIKGNRSALFNHLNVVHNLKLGNPDNIVFVKEFLNLIEKKLNSKICLYCEGIFKDWQILKEHLRKKKHKHLNPYSKEYDEFYLINYLKPNTKWYRSKKSQDSDNENADNFDDWVDINECESLICLFCEIQHSNLNDFKDHLIKIHHFDFDTLNMYPYYRKVQIINYIRTRTKILKCLYCDLKFDTLINLNKHFKNDNHNQLPVNDLWNSDEYYQPVIENDLLLRLIDVDDSNDLYETQIIPE